ncbi:MAG: hypothetical protein ACP5RE_03715 [Candidatus Acidifodinimicrobium sp.]
MFYDNYLPGIPSQYWERYIQQNSPVSAIAIKSGESSSVLNKTVLNQRGIMRKIFLAFDSPLVEAQFNIDGQTIFAGVNDLFYSGQTRAESGMPYVVRYDQSHNVYAIAWFPDAPFNNDLSVSVKNYDSRTIFVSTFFEILLFRPGFYEALRELVNGNGSVYPVHNPVPAIIKPINIP